MYNVHLMWGRNSPISRVKSGLGEKNGYELNNYLRKISRKTLRKTLRGREYRKNVHKILTIIYLLHTENVKLNKV